MAAPRTNYIYAEDHAHPGEEPDEAIARMAELYGENTRLPHYIKVAKAMHLPDQVVISAIARVRKQRPELSPVLDGFYNGHSKRKV